MDFKNEGKRRHEKTSELLLDVERQQHKKSGIAFLRNCVVTGSELGYICLGHNMLQPIAETVFLVFVPLFQFLYRT
jgi:hypothetical protein